MSYLLKKQTKNYNANAALYYIALIDLITFLKQIPAITNNFDLIFSVKCVCNSLITKSYVQYT